MTAGAAVAVCIRPEFIQILPGEPGRRPNVFRGRVETLLFVGDACEGEVRVGSAVLVARLTATADVKEGDEVLLHVDTAHTDLFELTARIRAPPAAAPHVQPHRPRRIPDRLPRLHARGGERLGGAGSLRALHPRQVRPGLHRPRVQGSLASFFFWA